MTRLILLLFLTISISSFAQRENSEEETEGSSGDLFKLEKEKLNLSKGDPNIEVALTPKEGNAITYLSLPTGSQLSIGILVYNHEAKKIKWNKVVVRYESQTKEFKIEPSIDILTENALYWQNKREYHEAGDVIYLDKPIPKSITIELYFQGYPKPVTIKKDLKPFSTIFTLPFKAEDLEPGEYLLSGATHGGNAQVFAYDIVVVGGKGKMSPKKNGELDTSENMRVFGKRVYAVCDGEIVEYNDTNPDNEKPGDRNSPHANFAVIKHGDLYVKYAHLKQGSLNPQFKVGSKVKAGDFIGQAGNSGQRTSGPHLHICVQRVDGGITPFMFSNGFVTNREKYTPGSTLEWTPLNGYGIPGFATQRSLIWPGQNPPTK